MPKPGETNNPHGRPPLGGAWAEIAREIGNEVVEDAKRGNISRRKQVLVKVYELAKEGEKWAVEFLANREDGQPKQMIDLSTATPITLLNWNAQDASSD